MNQDPLDPRAGLFSALVGGGRSLLSLLAVCLMLSGGFALFLSASGHFLPQDVQFLGMDKDQLCGLNQCRIVHFMFHDRVSFGGALIAIGWLYLWLAQFPLKAGEAWAWWVFCLSGIMGFGSFLAYLGYGYLDSWHGVATLFLLPIYLLGMTVSWHSLPRQDGLSSLLKPGTNLMLRTQLGLGRALLLATASGMMLGGTIIFIVGMTRVFVPQDLRYLGLTVRDLQLINPRLIWRRHRHLWVDSFLLCLAGATLAQSLASHCAGRRCWIHHRHRHSSHHRLPGIQPLAARLSRGADVCRRHFLVLQIHARFLN